MTTAMAPHAAVAVPLQAMPWWSTPAGLAFGFQMPVLALVAWAGQVDDGSGAITIRALRFLDGPHLLLAFALVLMAALGGLIGARLRLSSAPADPGDGWNAAALAIGAIALLAYLVWFRDYLANPVLLWQVLSGAHVPDRSDIVLTPGITSLVNMAPVFFTIVAHQCLVARRPIGRAMAAMAVVLMALTLFRVYAWSERLALIEALLPLGLASAAVLMRRQGVVSRVLRWLGPYAAIPFVVLFFGLAEANRSWASDTYNGKQDFWTFVLGRLAAYYYTALNNGAGLLQTTDWPSGRLEFVLGWLQALPGIGPQAASLLGSSEDLPEFFHRYADAEFNNPSGLYTVVLDLGLPLALAYMACFGLAAGLMHRAWRDGQLLGVLVYPVLFITALETFRFTYLGEARAFTWVLGIGLALLVRRISVALQQRRHELSGRSA